MFDPTGWAVISEKGRFDYRGHPTQDLADETWEFLGEGPEWPYDDCPIGCRQLRCPDGPNRN